MPIRYLLDTNICIYIAKHHPPAVRARFEQLSADALAMSVITLGELQHGAEKSQSRPKALLALQQLQSAIQVMPLTPAAGEHYGQIRSSLERAGQPIGNNDLWIAAHARAEGWVLVTNNEREFRRVEGLAVENWVAPAQDT
ncbi:type II toxin-antitoxin system tRNA(fMet)-specific endonuclease VapC [Extensimonas perlucida]|jgi:tRNA(fMet)-specific endonuclease VapC|uniref:type II toxin-antitoxin system tRNA(fMet)-specific endonuclease VapC n=1 Tax=Extensimonas perlucida TaxID=2590786 RepID=UPI00119E65E3|nr:type II toxin-antitoxin system VapC family toxin [Extensimonas perlucida]MBC7215721.1 type II toxin-antitoxin system VapC family toxin [Burkholderiaceae bacterium]